MKTKPVLLFIYNSFRDPLFQNILLSYTKQIQADKKDFIFHVITFEQPEYKVPEAEKESTKRVLAAQNIYWHPLEFHTGPFLLAKKFWDMCTAVGLVGKLRVKYRVKTILAFANVAAAYSYLLSRLFRMKFMIYSYEPHSEFMAELGVWNRQRLRYKILKSLEEKAGEKADVVLTGTRFMVEELEAKGVRGKVFRAPTGVDEELFRFRPLAREQIRNRLEVGSRKVVLYMGKFGDLYYKEEVIAFFSGLYQVDPTFYFVVITRYPHQEVRSWFEQYKIPVSGYYITGNLSDEEVKEYLSAADIGISAVPPSPSQKYRSPTKVGEYLMCGLPYVTCRGVSEDDIYADNCQVGIVVPQFSVAAGKDKAGEVNRLLSEQKDQLRERCRSVGIEYRSKNKVVRLIEEQLKGVE